MNTYAIVKLGPSQQKVSVGDVVVTDRMDKEVGSKFTVSDVYLLSDGEKVTVGKPTVDAPVEFEVVSHTQGDKVRIHKFKAKSKYKRTTGFRAKLTTLKVLAIGNTVETKKVTKEKVEKAEETKVAAKPKKAAVKASAKK